MKQDNFDELLRRSGLKNTKTRSAILEILEKSEQPVTAEQVFLELKNKQISANLSTVYRTLETLAEKMLAKKLNISGDSRAMFEYNRLVHRHYLVCLECKKIIPIDFCPIKNYEKTLEEKTKFKIAGHKLDVYGYCPDCQNKIQE
ncbi:MAG TPA: transcriptional repressor [Clostridiales bacterium]|nr:transcriptional repressor [Clostridiales bacterium]